jgi:tetratricopeptide (TPR) repeat protein
MQGCDDISTFGSLSSMPTNLNRAQKDAVDRRVLIGVYLLLAALTWAVFGQTLGHQFVEYDDQNYVYENPEITAGLTIDGFIGAFAHPHARNWHPLTTISHMLDCQLFGLNPAGHHLTSVLLHMAAVLLLFSALWSMTGMPWRSAFVAAIFAIHPLRVESVAWVAERKDVLSALLCMLTLGAYTRYAHEPSLKRYLWTASFFALGLMSKATLITLPLVLLVLDYWPLARCRGPVPAQVNEQNLSGKESLFSSQRLIAEKIPLLFFSLLAAIATLVAQRQTVSYGDQLPLTWRLNNGLVSCVVYIAQMIWPAKLAVFYPHAAESLPFWEITLAVFFFAAITAMAFAFRKARPYLIVGWSWYLIFLIPVIGVIQVGLQARADRYTYLSQIGLYVALTWAAADLSIFSKRRRPLLACLAIAAIGILAWRGWIQTSYWNNTESLWNHTIAVTSDNDLAHNNVAALLMRRGEIDDAISHYEQALKSHPHHREAHYYLSIALLHNNLANALARKGRVDDAIVHYRKAVELKDDFADAHSNLAAMLARKGQTGEALAHYEKATVIAPEDAGSHQRLASMLLKAGREEEAIAHYRRALEIEPGSIVALNGLAWSLATSRDATLRNGREAVALAEKASQLRDGKDNPIVLRTLAASYAESGRFLEAVSVAERALRSASDSALVHALEGEIERYSSGATYAGSREHNKR